MAPKNKQVEKACSSLEQSITKVIEEHNKYPPNGKQLEKECFRYVRHANHILRALVPKRTSLQYALEAFEESSKAYIRAFSKLSKSQEDRQRDILMQWFMHFLRLRDGFQLMESGERRHTNDCDEKALGTRFPSRLSGALRSDGVTRKFKSQLGYTGFGWDEFYDDDVGIRKQLLETLLKLTGKQRAGIINRWQVNMDQHETQRKLLNEQLTSIHRNFLANMNQLLASRGEPRLDLITDDKFEKITWGRIDIKREGNKFAITEEGGSVPIGLTLSDWKEKFCLKQPKPTQEDTKPKSKKVIRKRNLLLEDSDEEDEPPKKPPTKQPPPAKNAQHSNSTGIEMRIRKETDAARTDKSSSLDEIKRQVGVSAKQLEAGHNQLDDEKRASSMAACNDELRELRGETDILGECIDQWEKLQTYRYPALDNLMEELSESLKEDFDRWRRASEQLSRVRSKVKGSTGEGSVELYEASESCREACMQLGNLFVDDVHGLISNQLHNLRQKKERTDLATSLEADLSESDCIFLKAAEQLYKKSLSLVTEQQSFQFDSMEKQPQEVQHLLLRARAQFNIGISLFELSQCDGAPKSEQRQLLSHALSAFEDVSQTCTEMRNKSLPNGPKQYDQLSSITKKNAMTQIFEAMELGDCAGNECGICLWKLNRFDEAETVIMKACETSKITDLEICRGEDLLGIAQSLCNSQRISLTLLDLSMQSLEKTSSKNKTAGDKFLAIAHRSIQRAMDISEEISIFAKKNSLNNNDEFNGIMKNVASCQSLEAEEKSITKLWEDKLSSHSTQRRDLPKNQQTHELNRGELNELFRPSILSDRRRVLVSDDRLKFRRKRTASKSSANSKIATESFHSAFVDSSGANVHSPQADEEVGEFMPWGDEMLKEEDRNKYPACCPLLPLDMPIDIRHALEEKLGDILPSNE